jgi:hypothetical protein
MEISYEDTLELANRVRNLEEFRVWLLEFEDPASALAWLDAGFHLRDALKWKWDGDFDDPLEAKEWRDAGFRPEEAYRWRVGGFEVDEAVDLKKRGFSPERARRELRR